MVRPKKRFGQHFLKAKGVVEKIVSALDIDRESVVLEIGAGTGVLTEDLLKRNPKKLIAVEVDKELLPLLKEKFGKYSNFELVNRDATKLNFCQFSRQLKLVGNLPYNVASLIVLNTVFSKDCVERAVYMVQKEVAERLTLKGKPSWLGIFVNTFFDSQYLTSVPPRFFFPPPKVVSAVVKFTPKVNPPPFHLEEYKEFLEKLFSQPKKMLRKKLPPELLQKAGISPDARVHQLTLKDIWRLYETYKSLE
ncbi:MAG TPA: ribosomal RNA small subunit methyltransferase A [Aquifex aeolicus]|uniref:Ribosomal RNA small subunit methyltransferase A n=1 Tax=Aquifex aeolicus TaxID=63363 RepID=A0A9D0YNP6_AQUAO|nr:ribosomal RNA small subunit methyltransferase A [Aquificales bacterium]HIP86426.1 ribosomal RNA small subunit methyltransferase A [Aquifex sp.]HIP98151.1 ribosomal RNA small subunit methyltransferase A [Aquifex aeolicus]HIQ26558.1 ribosomal RNA small subunit methyltransferase A [Aquifex aeolicus]